MLRIASIAAPAALLGIVGLFLGYVASGTTQAIISTVAGMLGGGIAGYAALGVLARLARPYNAVVSNRT